MTTTPLSSHLSPWIDHLRAVVWRHVGVMMPWTPLICLLHNRLRRMMARFLQLETAWRAGTLRAPRPRTPRPGRKATPQPVRLPTAHMWLVKLIQPTALYYGPVQALLAEPDTRALVEAAPQAGRVLRPLARMFGVEQPAWLRLPKRKRKPRPKPEPKPKPRLRLRPISFTRAQIDRMTAAELTAIYGRLPPHFPLPIPNLNYIRRKIASG